MGVFSEDPFLSQIQYAKQVVWPVLKGMLNSVSIIYLKMAKPLATHNYFEGWYGKR
jgi:hypothetical protein